MQRLVHKTREPIFSLRDGKIGRHQSKAWKNICLSLEATSSNFSSITRHHSFRPLMWNIVPLDFCRTTLIQGSQVQFFTWVLPRHSASSHHLKMVYVGCVGDSKLAIRVNSESVNGCLSLYVGQRFDRLQPVCGVLCLPTKISWDRLQHSRDPYEGGYFKSPHRRDFKQGQSIWIPTNHFCLVLVIFFYISHSKALIVMTFAD